MAMKSRCLLLLTLTFLFGFSGEANAALTKIGKANYLGSNYNLIYEDDSIYGGLIWLDYTRSWVPILGEDGWPKAALWVSGLGGDLTVTLDPGYTTTIDWSSGWRLPKVDESKMDLYGPWSTDVGDGTGFGWGGPDGAGYHDYYSGLNMVNSEMGHLFYESLRNKGYYAEDGTNPQPGWGLTNTGDFDNLQAGRYWSGTLYSPNTDQDYYWVFDFWTGFQPGAYPEITYYDALAVRPGDVSFNPVPIPSTLWLLGSGLIGLVGIRREFLP
jgi:hypothetical protein